MQAGADPVLEPAQGGNSDTLCDAFLNGVQAGGHAAGKVFLGDQDIHCCLTAADGHKKAMERTLFVHDKEDKMQTRELGTAKDPV